MPSMQLPRLRLGAVVVMAAVLVACAAPTSPAGPRTSPTGSAAEPSPTAGASRTPRATSGASPTGSSPAEVAAEPPPLALEPVATGLADPIGVATAPGGWLLVNERAGRVIAVQPDRGETSVALDITDRVLGQGEQGLLGLALHPDWPDDARAFVHYSDRNGDTVLSELTGTTTDAGAPSLDAGSERHLLEVDQPYPNHNGGQLAFGPDGYLWMGLGDGGAGGDPHGNGQNLDALLGKVLRLDVSQPGGYAIPPDNPFANGGGAPEAYLYGLRNPWRFSFDRATDALWIADVGQNVYEEVDRLDPAADAGANLGWNIMEGLHCFAEPDCSTEGLVLPITEYGRDAGCSITGGHVYRGDAIADLQGWYLFSDYCSGILFGIASDAEPPAPGEAVEPRVLLETGASVTSFGEDVDGELYLTDIGSGTLYRIVGGG